MPDRVPVIAYIRDDRDDARQTRLIVKYCTEHRLNPVIRARTPQAAAQAVGAGHAAIVVAVSDLRDGLRHVVAIAGGTVRFVRERSRRPSLRDWLARAANRGATPSAIGQLVGEDTEEVRRVMREFGIDPPSEN